MEMFTITGKRNEDLKKANNRKLVKSYFIGNDVLYGAIAQHLGIAIDGLNVEQLKAAINEKNAELACVGVPVIDQPAVTIAGATMKAVKFDRPVAVPPVKRPMPVVKGGLSAATMRPGVVVGRSRSIQRPVKNGMIV
jgi:hypothetical protein